IHPVSESITVLSGTAVAAVEGREYSLSPLDNILIPRGLAHAVWNISGHERALLHVALASDAPTREMVSTRYERRSMPPEAAGPVPERVVVDERCATVQGDPWREKGSKA